VEKRLKSHCGGNLFNFLIIILLLQSLSFTVTIASLQIHVGNPYGEGSLRANLNVEATK